MGLFSTVCGVDKVAILPHVSSGGLDPYHWTKLVSNNEICFGSGQPFLSDAVCTVVPRSMAIVYLNCRHAGKKPLPCCPAWHHWPSWMLDMDDRPTQTVLAQNHGDCPLFTMCKLTKTSRGWVTGGHEGVGMGRKCAPLHCCWGLQALDQRQFVECSGKNAGVYTFFAKKVLVARNLDRGGLRLET